MLLYKKLCLLATTNILLILLLSTSQAAIPDATILTASTHDIETPNDQAKQLNTAAHAQILATYWQQAQQQRLWQNPYWLKLMYYSPNGHGIQSDVRTHDFFMSAQGASDPEHELYALLEQMLTPAQGSSDQHVACLFPARVAWLQEQLAITPHNMPPVACPQYHAWVNGINPQFTTLVFSSGFVDSPSSMYGHTLLRIDPNDNQSQRLISYAVNYSAQTDKDSGVKYAYKGLTGGFNGSFALMPYYEKVKEYGASENRDLWEYELNFSPAETLRLMQHLWELRRVQFPYYYIHSNCSYELLALLEIARPGLQLRERFHYVTIPTDTLRVALLDAKLLKKVIYRPSDASKLLAQTEGSSVTVIAAAQHLMQNPALDIQHLTLIEQAQALTLAADYLYRQHVAGQQDTAIRREQLRQLMLRRSVIDVVIPEIPVPQPTIDPSRGHKTSRVQLGLAHTAQGHNVTTFELRPSYHDLLDTDGGYQKSAAISFFRTRLELDQHQLSLHDFELLGIQSIAAKSIFLTPKSWGMSIGVHRAKHPAAIAIDQSSPLVAYANGNIGISQDIYHMSCYGLLQSSLEVLHEIPQDVGVGAGTALGCLYLSPRVNLQIDLHTTLWDKSTRPTDNNLSTISTHSILQSILTTGVQIPLNADNALRLNWQKTLHNTQDTTYAMSWIRYF